MTVIMMPCQESVKISSGSASAPAAPVAAVLFSIPGKRHPLAVSSCAYSESQRNPEKLPCLSVVAWDSRVWGLLNFGKIQAAPDLSILIHPKSLSFNPWARISSQLVAVKLACLLVC